MIYKLQRAEQATAAPYFIIILYKNNNKLNNGR
jgi:hypothetical protein